MGNFKVKNTFFIIISLLLVTFTCLPPSETVAKADIGPKPKVVITFENMSDELCYVTLLSEDQGGGPHNVYTPGYEHEYEDPVEQQVYNAFINYEDKDGFYYLQFHRPCGENKEFTWGYYPPEVFKILIYYPASNTFIAGTEIIERYAFSSYYTVDMQNVTVTDFRGEDAPKQEVSLQVGKSYDFTQEVRNLGVRILLTIAVELLVALLFRYRSCAVWGAIIVTNVITQIILNLTINVVNYFNGPLSAVIWFVLMEIVVFVIEAIAYSIVLKRKSDKRHPSRSAVLYSFLANASSLALGYVLAFTSLVTFL